MWNLLPCGSDAEPQQGATLIIEVGGLDERQALPGAALPTLRGPGIAEQQSLAVQGLAPSSGNCGALQPASPCGLELMLFCGSRLVAIPRSTLLLNLEA